MPFRKLKHAFTFLLLLEAGFLIFLRFLEENEIQPEKITINTRYGHDKHHINAVLYLKSRTVGLQNYRSLCKSFIRDAVIDLHSGISYFKSDFHQFNLTYKRLIKLMLFPVHSFW